MFPRKIVSLESEGANPFLHGVRQTGKSILIKGFCVRIPGGLMRISLTFTDVC